MTEKSREAFQGAVLEAQKSQNPNIEPVHLFLEILRQKEGIPVQVLESLAVNTHFLIKDLEQELSLFPKVSGSASPPFPSNDFIQILTRAEKEAEKQGDAYISTEHFILALFSSSQKKLKEIFQKHKLDEQIFLKAIKKLRGNKKIMGSKSRKQI